MKTPPPRRTRRLALWLMLALSISLIASTVLLSNDMRHLHRVAAWLGHDLFPEPVPPEIQPAPPPPKAIAEKSSRPVVLDIPARLMDDPQPDLAGNFMRTWRTSGPAICDALRKAGIGMTQWRAAAMGSTTFECTFQEVYKQDGERPLSSVFVIVRGDSKGAIQNMRAKIVGPVTDSAGRLDGAAIRIFETLLEQPHWLDFRDALGTIRELKDVKQENFGASVSFAREFTSENSFNFIMTIKAAPGPQTRTRAYFSVDRWMPAPDEQVSQSLPPVFR